MPTRSRSRTPQGRKSRVATKPKSGREPVIRTPSQPRKHSPSRSPRQAALTPKNGQPSKRPKTKTKLVPRAGSKTGMSCSSIPMSTSPLQRFVEGVEPWLWENASVFFIAQLVAYIAWPAFGIADDESVFVATEFWETLLRIYAGGHIIIEGILMIQHFLIYVRYAHVPFFWSDQQRPVPTLRSVCFDWNRTMNPAMLVAAAIAASYFHTAPAVTLNELVADFELSTFIFRFVFVRFINDVAFYAVHWCLHSKFLYKTFHKRHHEHIRTMLFTNYHFDIIDEVAEGFLPVFASLLFLNLMRWLTGSSLFSISFHDVILYIAYDMWYQIGTHCGKPVRYISVFPPFSVLINAIYPIDQHNVLHHEKHHNLTNCNYGITPWVDETLDTLRM